MSSYYQRNKEKVKARMRDYYQRNKKKRKACFKRYELTIKREVLGHYGNGSLKCRLCPESRLGALHIDHINGGGKQHRKLIHRKGGGAFYRWLRKQGYPPGYRTLCSNCNWKEYLKNTLSSLLTHKKNVKARERWARYKLILLNQIGNCCAKCGCQELEILTVNHEAEDGATHRRLISNGKGGQVFYKAVVQSGDYSGLECLCFSCNDAATYEKTI